MYDDVLTRNENEELAVRTVISTEQSTVVNPNDVYTRDIDGNLCIRTVGSGGSDVHNKGYFATQEALEEAYPTAESGDYALVGTTDTFWVWDEDSSGWVNTGNQDTTTFLPFPNTWHTTSSYTTQQFCDSVAADTTAIVGKAFLGEVTLNDLPASIANSELEVKIMDGITVANKVIVLELYSGNISPYKWQYIYWNGGSNVSGWIATGAQVNSDWNATSGVQEILNKPTIPTKAQDINAVPQYTTMPTANASNVGEICQFAGTTDANYTNGYFYKNVVTQTQGSAVGTQTAGSGLTNIQVNVATWEEETGMTEDGSLTMHYFGDGWNLSPNAVGVTFDGTPVADDEITVVYTAGTTTYDWERTDVQPTPVIPDPLPSQTGNAGKFLTTNGTDVSWKDITVTTTATLVAADWSNNAQTITVQGVTTTNVVFVSPDPASLSDYASAGITCVSQGTNSLTFNCVNVPSNAITVSIVML